MGKVLKYSLENVGDGKLSCDEAFYVTARNELIRRISLRDAVTLAYISLVAGFSGYAFAADKRALLLLIPYLTFGFVNIFAHHNAVIGALGFFLKKELKCAKDEKHWDNSETLLNYQNQFILFRTLSAAIIFLLPPFVSLFLLAYWGFWYTSSENISLIRLGAWSFGFAITLASAWLLWRVHNFRRQAAMGKLKDQYYPLQ